MKDITPTSTEIMAVSTQLLCEQVSTLYGTDRSFEVDGMRIDAEWRGSNDERVRFIHHGGLGTVAVYTLRLQDNIGDGVDTYRYNVEEGVVRQLDRHYRQTPITLPPRVINIILYTAFE